MNRREFASVLAAAAAAGFPSARAGAAVAQRQYDVPPFGNVHLLHITDCHAQLLPLYFREPSVNLGVGMTRNAWPHLVGQAFLGAAGLKRKSPEAYAFTALDFESNARLYGKVGGFAHLATLVKRLRGGRSDALLLDGGDTWQGSATSLWTNGQDMVDAAKLLGVEVMTGHWDFTYGEERLRKVVEQDFKGKVEFVAQNVRTQDFGDPVFKPYVIKELGGVPVAIVGQAFPYTPIANPAWLTPNWSFGLREQDLQQAVSEARSKGAKAVVLLSHNGMDVDLKMASRITGIDVILGGHTHDGVPIPITVENPGGRTIVTNAGSNGKFLAVIDLQVGSQGVQSFQYRLLPVFSRLLAADPQMQTLIDGVRKPYLERLAEPLAVTEGTLYRRGNFNGSFDELLLDALMAVRGAEIAFSPGFRWGTSMLAGQTLTREQLMNQTAITYPWTTLTEMTGETIKTILEDVADNLFNPDPYYQQGGDMVRVGGMTYAISPTAAAGRRISDMRLSGRPLQADKLYKVAGWASVSESNRNGGPPIWDVAEQYLKAHRRIHARAPRQPRLLGMEGNAGLL